MLQLERSMCLAVYNNTGVQLVKWAHGHNYQLPLLTLPKSINRLGRLEIYCCCLNVMWVLNPLPELAQKGPSRVQYCIRNHWNSAHRFVQTIKVQGYDRFILAAAYQPRSISYRVKGPDRTVSAINSSPKLTTFIWLLVTIYQYWLLIRLAYA